MLAMLPHTDNLCHHSYSTVTKGFSLGGVSFTDIHRLPTYILPCSYVFVFEALIYVYSSNYTLKTASSVKSIMIKIMLISKFNNTCVKVLIFVLVISSFLLN